MATDVIVLAKDVNSSLLIMTTTVSHIEGHMHLPKNYDTLGSTKLPLYEVVVRTLVQWVKYAPIFSIGLNVLLKNDQMAILLLNLTSAVVSTRRYFKEKPHQKNYLK